MQKHAGLNSLQHLASLSLLIKGRHDAFAADLRNDADRLLKGPYHAVRFFGSLDRREFADLDLLIKKEDLAAVEHLFVNRGYSRESGVLLNLALTSRFTHALDFAKEEFSNVAQAVARSGRFQKLSSDQLLDA